MRLRPSRNTRDGLLPTLLLHQTVCIHRCQLVQAGLPLVLVHGRYVLYPVAHIDA